MGFLSLAKDIDMRKGILSVWFRIPSASAAAVRAAFAGASPGPEYNGLLGVIPLLTFGPQQTATVYESGSRMVPHTSEPDEGYPDFGPVSYVSGSHTSKTPMSYIGVYYPGSDDPTHDGCLVVSLRTANFALAANLQGDITSLHEDPEGHTTINREDATYIFQGQQQSFTNIAIGSFDGFGGATGAPSIGATDTWHHLILSWNLTNGSSSHGVVGGADWASDGIETVSKLWCSIDDVNKNGMNLPGLCPGIDGGPIADPNAIVTSLTYAYAGADVIVFDAPPTVSVTVSSVPSNPIRIPGPPLVETSSLGDQNPVMVVEKAHFQLFTGVSLDTSVEANRRLFVTSGGKPADKNAAEIALGVAPKIRLIKSADWKTGKNTGSAGNLTPTGTIENYETGPSLGG